MPGGSFEVLMRSISEQLMTLPDDTVVYPGHGPATTIGHERTVKPLAIAPPGVPKNFPSQVGQPLR